MTKHTKARAIGFNHVALEVGDIDEALEFYAKFIDFELRGKGENMAFIDLGDQFLALQTNRKQPRDDDRHFGLVVSDQDAVRKSLVENGIEILEGPFLDFYDPWGNRVEIVTVQHAVDCKGKLLTAVACIAHSEQQRTIRLACSNQHLSALQRHDDIDSLDYNEAYGIG